MSCACNSNSLVMPICWDVTQVLLLLCHCVFTLLRVHFFNLLWCGLPRRNYESANITICIVLGE